MATRNTYNECCENLQKYPLYELTDNGETKRVYKPNLIWLFGKKLLIDECNLLNCSEGEKSRHLREDRLLRTLYIENHPHSQRVIEKSKSIAHYKGVNGFSKL
ncbi:MAG: hypothetical protein ACRCUJ_14435 [Phocaeicola sp.]